MTIQLSVTIWTVICFILLMVILHNLLFKPVLRVMDQRRERIDRAAAKKAENQRLAEEYQAAYVQEQAALESAQKRQVKDQVEALRAETKHQIDLAKDARLQELDDYRTQSEQERAEILESLKVHLPELAAVFAESITKE